MKVANDFEQDKKHLVSLRRELRAAKAEVNLKAEQLAMEKADLFEKTKLAVAARQDGLAKNEEVCVLKKMLECKVGDVIARVHPLFQLADANEKVRSAELTKVQADEALQEALNEKRRNDAQNCEIQQKLAEISIKEERVETVKEEFEARVSRDVIVLQFFRSRSLTSTRPR